MTLHYIHISQSCLIQKKDLFSKGLVCLSGSGLSCCAIYVTVFMLRQFTSWDLNFFYLCVHCVSSYEDTGSQPGSILVASDRRILLPLGPFLKEERLCLDTLPWNKDWYEMQWWLTFWNFPTFARDHRVLGDSSYQDSSLQIAQFALAASSEKSPGFSISKCWMLLCPRELSEMFSSRERCESSQSIKFTTSEVNCISKLQDIKKKNKRLHSFWTLCKWLMFWLCASNFGKNAVNELIVSGHAGSNGDVTENTGLIPFSLSFRVTQPLWHK